MLTCNLFHIRNYVLQPIMKERQAPSLYDGGRPRASGLNEDQAPLEPQPGGLFGAQECCCQAAGGDRGQGGAHVGKELGAPWWTESQPPELPVTQPQSLWTCELPCQEGFEMRDVPGSRWAQRHPGVLTGRRRGSEGRWNWGREPKEPRGDDTSTGKGKGGIPQELPQAMPPTTLSRTPSG